MSTTNRLIGRRPQIERLEERRLLAATLPPVQGDPVGWDIDETLVSQIVTRLGTFAGDGKDVLSGGKHAADLGIHTHWRL